MIEFTTADITAARDNDLEATQLLMDVMLPVIDNIARKLASQIHGYGSDLEEDLASEGRLELWRLISEHDGSERHGPGWLVKSVHAAMINSRIELVSPGASRHETETYLTCLKRTDYDAAAALKMATELPAGKRLSPSAAYAAQQAVTLPLRLDARVGMDGSASRGDTIPDKPYSAPEDDWNLGARIAAVHETLDGMSERQAEIVMRLHGYEEDWLTIASALGENDATNVKRNKTHAERNFHAKFPWSKVYPGDKPVLNPNRDTRSK